MPSFVVIGLEPVSRPAATLRGLPPCSRRGARFLDPRCRAAMVARPGSGSQRLRLSPRGSKKREHDDFGSSCRVACSALRDPDDLAVPSRGSVRSWAPRAARPLTRAPPSRVSLMRLGLGTLASRRVSRCAVNIAPLPLRSVVSRIFARARELLLGTHEDLVPPVGAPAGDLRADLRDAARAFHRAGHRISRRNSRTRDSQSTFGRREHGQPRRQPMSPSMGWIRVAPATAQGREVHSRQGGRAAPSCHQGRGPAGPRPDEAPSRGSWTIATGTSVLQLVLELFA